MSTRARTKSLVRPASGTQYVALYCRLSPRPDGKYEGVKSQEKWGRAYAGRRWPGVPVVVFADSALSAADEDVYRPGYEALREAIGRGEVLAVWVVEQERIERVEVKWFRLAAEMDAAGISELHTDRGGIVRVLDEVAGIKAVLAGAEVRKIKRRTNDRLDAIADEGRPSGAKVFGYRRGTDEGGGKTLVIVEEEASLIREAAERFLSGWGLSNIADDLRARGVIGTKRRKVRDAEGEIVGTETTTITYSTVRSWLTNATIVGKRVHRQQVIGDGIWEPILDIDTWNAVRDRLAAPKRVVTNKRGREQAVATSQRAPGRRYLFTGGIAVCGVCKAPLSGTLIRTVPSYLCHPKNGGRACVAITAGLFETEVTARLFAELDKPEFLDAINADDRAAQRDEITKDIRKLEQRRRVLVREWSRGDLTDDEWNIGRKDIAALEGEQRAALAAIPPAPPSRIDPVVLREAWEDMPLDERREYISMFVARVEVNRVIVHGSHRFDPNRIPPVTWVRRRAMPITAGDRCRGLRLGSKGEGPGS